MMRLKMREMKSTYSDVICNLPYDFFFGCRQLLHEATVRKAPHHSTLFSCHGENKVTLYFSPTVKKKIVYQVSSLPHKVGLAVCKEILLPQKVVFTLCKVRLIL